MFIMKQGPDFMEKIYHQALIILLEEEQMEYESEKEFDVKFHEMAIKKLYTQRNDNFGHSMPACRNDGLRHAGM